VAKASKSGGASEASLQRKLKLLEKEEKLLESIVDKTTEQKDLLEKIKKLKEETLKKIEKQKDYIFDIQEGYDDLEQSLGSIGNLLGKNNGLYKQHEERMEKVKVVTSSLGAVISSNSKLSETHKRQLVNIAKAYQQHESAIANIQKEVKRKNLSEKEAAELIIQENKALKDVTSQFSYTGEGAEEILDVIRNINKESDEFGKSAQKTQEAFQNMDQMMGQFSGIPAMQELNTLLKTGTAQTLAFKAAAFALGAALAVAAYDYFGAPIKATMQASHEEKMSRINTAKNVASIQNKYNFRNQQQSLDLAKIQIDNAKNIAQVQNDAAYAGQRAAISFSTQMRQGAAQFQAAAKTAQYGGQLGPTGYNTAELSLAGVDPGQIVQQMSQLASVTGKVPTPKLATDMTLLAKRTGQSSDSIASLTEYFQRADNLSAETAVNMVDGMRAMAKASNLDLGNLMQGVAEASKDALSYNIKSAEALTKQVAAAQSIGVNFNKLASAGRRMVLNYKDSIKSEMELSGLLGRSVNLTEVRQKAMSGDYEGMMEAMKAQGLDPSQMTMQQQEALSQSMGGLDLDSIQKIFKGEVKTPADLTKGDAEKGGKQFLGATKAAQATLSSESARISADQAIMDAKLSAKIAEEYQKKMMPGGSLNKFFEDTAAREKNLEQATENLNGTIEQAFLSSKQYRDFLADSMKENMMHGFLDNLAKGTVGVLGGVFGTSVLGMFAKKPKEQTTKVDSGGGIISSFMGLFSKKSKQETPPAQTEKSTVTPLLIPAAPTAPAAPIPTPNVPTTPVGGGLLDQLGALITPAAAPAAATNVPSGLVDQFGETIKSAMPGGQSISGTLADATLPLPVIIVGGSLESEGTSMLGGGESKEESGEKKGFWASVKDRIGKTWEKITGFFKGIKDGIMNAWKGVTGFFTGIWKGVTDSISSVWKGVTGFFTGIWKGVTDSISSVWENVSNFFSGIWKGVGDRISNLWGSVTGWFSGLIDGIKQGWDRIKTGFIDNVKKGWEKVVGFFTRLIDGIKKFFTEKIGGLFKRKGLATAVGAATGGGGEEGGEGGAGMPAGIGGVAAQAKAFSNVDFKGAGKGIGSFLENVGKGAGSFIQNIMTGIANGLMQFANPLVIAGAAGLAASIALIGAGIAGAAWIMGKALPTLAKGMASFNDVDGGNLVKVGLGVTALGLGMAAMGVGSVVAGIGNLIGGLFGGGIEDTIKKMETFSNANINVEKVKNNADAAVAYAKAMAAVGAGSAVSGLGNLVGSIADGIAGFFGKKPPIDQMVEFGKLDIPNADKIKQNAETFAIFGNAMSSYKGGSGSIGGVLGDALAGFFKVKPPIEAMKDFAKEDFGKYKDQIKLNAEAFTMFGNAMATYKGSSGGLGEQLAQGVAGFFKTPSPLDKFKEFAAVTGIDVDQTKKNAEAFTAFGNAMGSYGGTKEGLFSSLANGISAFFGGKTDIISEFQRFAAIDAGGAEKASTAFLNFSNTMTSIDTSTWEGVGEGISAFVDQIDDGEIKSLGLFGDALAKLSAPLVSFGSSVNSLPNLDGFGQSFKNFAANLTTDANFVKNIQGLGTTINPLITVLDTLSTTMSKLVSSLMQVSSIDVSTLNMIPWKDMHDFAATGGGNFSITIKRDEQQNIDILAALASLNIIEANSQQKISLLNNQINTLFKGQNGIYANTSVALKSYNRINSLLDVQKSSKDSLLKIKENTNDLKMKLYVRESVMLQEQMVDYLEASAGILEQIYSSQNENKPPTIYMDGKVVSNVMNRRIANATARASIPTNLR